MVLIDPAIEVCKILAHKHPKIDPNILIKIPIKIICCIVLVSKYAVAGGIIINAIMSMAPVASKAAKIVILVNVIKIQ